MPGGDEESSELAIPGCLCGWAESRWVKEGAGVTAGSGDPLGCNGCGEQGRNQIPLGSLTYSINSWGKIKGVGAPLVSSV